MLQLRESLLFIPKERKTRVS